MFLPTFVAFGLFLNLPQSTENQEVVLKEIIIDQNVTGVLGEEVHLLCLYAGKYNISDSSWKRLDSGKRAKMMAGYKHGKSFAKDNFSPPASHTNLTVKVSINSLEVQGQYICVFSTDEEEIMESLFLSVIARPHVNTHAMEDILNGTHYQNIFCSASYAKPSASIHWDIHGAPPSEDIFSINSTYSIEPNGTVSVVSMLRFPIHLNNETSVACVIQHPALTEPSTTIIQLQTFVSPNVTMEVVLIEKEGKGFLEVLCRAEGGRPHPSITWIPEPADISGSPHFLKYESVSSSHYFPLDDYEGENITCIFGYPHISAIERTITLPAYYLTSLQLTNCSIKVNLLNASDLLILEEEDSDIRISMEVLGNVPRYKINCTKDGEPLSEDVKVVVSDLMIKGPVGANHVGQYQCQASYYKHTASLQFEIDVKPRVRVPEPPRSYLSIGLQKNDTHWAAVCEYKSDGAAANISWVISDTNTAAIPLTTNITRGDSKVLATCIYTFELCQHEGQFLACVIHKEYGEAERRTIQVPHFFISSIVVLNKTIPLHGNHGQNTGLHRVALKEHVSNQRIIFRVNGNASECKFKCFRLNGLPAHTEGMALVFAQQVSGSDAGLYTCIASWYHHNATVTVLVDVTSQAIHSSIVMLILICFSSAVAITLILMVTLCLFCKRHEEIHSSTQDWKKHESLAALMQDPRSPELNKARRQGQEYAELVHYSIVIDVKSTV